MSPGVASAQTKSSERSLRPHQFRTARDRPDREGKKRGGTRFLKTTVIVRIASVIPSGNQEVRTDLQDFVQTLKYYALER